MKNIFIMIVVLLVFSGCTTSHSQPKVDNTYKYEKQFEKQEKQFEKQEKQLEKQEKDFKRYKKYRDCIDSYNQRTTICVYFNSKGEEILRKAKVKKCIKDKFPRGRKSCEIK